MIKMKNDFIFKYYMYCVFVSADFTRGIHLVYLLHHGFDNTFTGIVQTILFLTTFLFEIPLGYLADKYKNKYMLLLGSLFFIMSGSIYLLFSNSIMICLLYFMQGIGFALCSGADFALLYNSLSKDDEELKTKYLATSRRISFFSLAAATFIGGVLADINWTWIFVSYILFHIIALIIISRIEEEEAETDEEKESLLPLSFKEVTLQNKNIIVLILGLAFLESFHTPFFIFFQNYLQIEGVPKSVIGLIIALAILSSSLILIFENKFKKINIYNQINYTIIGIMLILILFYFVDNIYIQVILFFLLNSIPSLLFVFTDNYLNLNIPNHTRATFMSLVSFINSFFIALVYLSFGKLFDVTDNLIVICSLGFLLIPTVILTNIYKLYFENEIKKT